MKRILLITFILYSPLLVFSQLNQAANEKLKNYEDSLVILGRDFIHNENDVERKNANYTFIKTLVSALKTPDSFNYNFDSLKTISILNSPDNKFRIFSWPLMNQDGSYRFYGAIQMNSSSLQLFPLEDYTAYIKSPEDTIGNHKTWYGAQYYQIIPVNAKNQYYVLLGWKGNTIKTTKKVIDKQQKKSRVVFEYSRQASMLLRFVPEEKLIVFDHLSSADLKVKDNAEFFGPDLSYDGYQLKNGRWIYVEDLDMRNVPNPIDEQYNDPKNPSNLQPPQKKTK
jgi:hypothetical protein